MFQSPASSLGPAARNSFLNVFAWSPSTGAVRRVSVAVDGGEPDGPSFNPTVSATGRYVAFESTATNLVPGLEVARSRIYTHDTTTGTTRLVSQAFDGTELDGHCTDPLISRDGLVVAFRSSASKLVPNDTNGLPDVFLIRLEGSPDRSRL